VIIPAEDLATMGKRTVGGVAMPLRQVIAWEGVQSFEGGKMDQIMTTRTEIVMICVEMKKNAPREARRAGKTPREG
jgi:hypothetical protein